VDFSFSEEQQMIAESLQTALTRTCQPADLRRLLADGQSRDEARWNDLCSLGLNGALVDEDKGGLGLTPIDFVKLAEACGAACLPEPLVHSAGIAVPCYAALVPAGDEVLEAALGAETTLSLHHPECAFVADAECAGAILMVAGDGVFLVPPDDLTLTPQPSIDPFRRLFTLSDPPADARRISDVVAAQASLKAAFDRGALFTAAELIGIAQRAIDMAVAYAEERQQFGRPIGANQAVKHLLAEAQVKIEFARPVLYAAAAALSHPDAYASARVSHAFVAASAAADLATRRSVQVHGAMGYSWEVDVHFYLKRALGLSSDWGGGRFHRARFIDRAMTMPLGPEITFARET